MTATVEAQLEDPRSPLWGDPPLPSWVQSFRPEQVDAIITTVNHFISGADVVLLNAPTGTGKTLIGECVRRLMNAKHTLYAPDSKDLQDQFVRDFPYAKLLKGRANYPTFDRPDLFDDRFNPITAADCTKKSVTLPGCSNCVVQSSEKPVWHCNWCHPNPLFNCPYEIAKRDALAARLAILNTSYFLAEANSAGRFGWNDKTGTPDRFVVIDECDVLESTLMNQVEVYISAKRIKELGLNFPEKKTVESSWIEWVEEHALPKVTQHAQTALQAIKNGDDSPTQLRWWRYTDQLAQRLTMLRESLMSSNAVYDGYEDGNIRFQPVQVAPFAPKMLWRHGAAWLMMSATIIDPLEFVDSLGVERAGLRWEIVNVDSTFPAERRPIHVKHAANMVYREKDTAWPRMAEMVKRVLEHHPEDRVLVHTVSYAFTQYLYEQLRNSGRTVLLYASAKERAKVLADYKRLEAAVLLAPSMDRGVDLKDDLCRVVVICKVPWANLKDKRVAARKFSKGGQIWFVVQAIRKLIQMSGRGMRSAEDRCDTYVLDEQFTSVIWKQHKNLLPKWWREAIDWSGGGL